MLILILFAEIGGRLMSPPVALTLWCFGAADALLLIKLTIWVASSYRTFGREERLMTVIALLFIGTSWYATRIWTFERQFDSFVTAQNGNFRLTLNELSGKILVFAADRSRHAPPAPQPDTWDRDVAVFLGYQNDTVTEFEARFGGEVRAAHDTLGAFGVTDRDFEMFYRRPADLFEMRVVAEKLAKFSTKIPD